MNFKKKEAQKPIFTKPQNPTNYYDFKKKYDIQAPKTQRKDRPSSKDNSSDQLGLFKKISRNYTKNPQQQRYRTLQNTPEKNKKMSTQCSYKQLPQLNQLSNKIKTTKNEPQQERRQRILKVQQQMKMIQKGKRPQIQPFKQYCQLRGQKQKNEYESIKKHLHRRYSTQNLQTQKYIKPIQNKVQCLMCQRAIPNSQQKKTDLDICSRCFQISNKQQKKYIKSQVKGQFVTSSTIKRFKQYEQRIKTMNCIICEINPKNCINFECRHVVCCMDCGKKCDRCPICRKQMKAEIIYL